MTFDEWWETRKILGYQYGKDELALVRMGWDAAMQTDFNRPDTKVNNYIDRSTDTNEEIRDDERALEAFKNSMQTIKDNERRILDLLGLGLIKGKNDE